MNNNEHGWPQETIVKVWDKGYIDPKWPASEWRYDEYNRWMHFSDYGNRDSKYGWEIDHITPISRGGGDNLENLQPLNWMSNIEKSNKPTIL